VRQFQKLAEVPLGLSAILRVLRGMPFDDQGEQPNRRRGLRAILHLLLKGPDAVPAGRAEMEKMIPAQL
jgi:hypothetical protein